MPKRKTTTEKNLFLLLERAFEAKAIVYGTGGPSPEQLFGAQIAVDILPLLAEHLEKIGKVKRIALVLHTKGGHIDAPWPLVNMIRSHCSEFVVLVPELALSGGTLIALGAAKIFMLPNAFLSPVDPTHSYKEAGADKSVSIEDVLGYMNFVTERIGIRDQTALVEALKELTKHVSPTVLGNIHRTHSLIERLSQSMLQLHLRSLSDVPRVDKIVDYLTHSLYAHNHMIPVAEARDVIGFGDLIPELRLNQRKAMHAARDYIRSELRHQETIDPHQELKQAKNDSVEICVNRAILVTSSMKHLFIAKRRIFKDDPKSEQVKMQPIQDRWERATMRRSDL